jgi:uracil-DNA glycosylase
MERKEALPESWNKRLGGLFDHPIMKDLKSFLKKEIDSGFTIYPKMNLIFKAFYLTPFEQTKIVLLGQDPYHGPGQAEGLCFSVPKGVPFPPSLLNIFKELNQDLGIKIPTHGHLESWGKQGVLLLNTTLTVRDSMPASHAKKGWEFFTDEVIKELSLKNEPVIFMLFGKHAQSKKNLINLEKHYIIEAPHPSPLSAHRGFFGSKPFSQANELLKKLEMKQINWNIEEELV